MQRPSPPVRQPKTRQALAGTAARRPQDIKRRHVGGHRKQRDRGAEVGAGGAGHLPPAERRFSAERTRAAVMPLLEERLRGVEYEADGSSALALELAERIKTAVRALYHERYKIVCFVVLGSVPRAEVRCCSRGMWSGAADGFVECAFQNGSLYALCVVYAVYHE
ncbi:dynein light chain Tctex-type 4 [Erpetoichthys calabaricus]|uniref:dynein light chain Tctex-type 4 n=1 Tax=Erpetoichthys calabaricus TaxID=27687 RepID=UPI00223446FF|nr:dynein light chain Tctex-type 4 [Erpetoichthys calabaricus]XP_051789011.1 dynein light chain Tctex-type 4 [Erpetoichthys calabaricus]